MATVRLERRVRSEVGVYVYYLLEAAVIAGLRFSASLISPHRATHSETNDNLNDITF